MPPPWANALAPYAHPVALGVCEHVSRTALATLEQRADHVDGRVHGQVEIDRAGKASVRTLTALDDDVST